MKILTYSQLGDEPRKELSGARWLLLHHSEIAKATSILMFTELDGILVGVDHRGQEINPGLWQRAVHLMIVDGTEKQANEIQKKTGITKVVIDDENDLRHHCW
tara:strand:- start:1385 stop:1693 length:309 start_codon:yes stop_codon:yes gene_type:complete